MHRTGSEVCLFAGTTPVCFRQYVFSMVSGSCILLFHSTPYFIFVNIHNLEYRLRVSLVYIFLILLLIPIITVDISICDRFMLLTVIKLFLSHRQRIYLRYQHIPSLFGLFYK